MLSLNMSTVISRRNLLTLLALVAIATGGLYLLLERPIATPLISEIHAQSTIVWHLKGVGISTPASEMNDMKTAGVELITTEWGMETPVSDAQAFLDRAQSAGLKVVMDGGFSNAAWGYLKQGNPTSQLPVWQANRVTSWVNTFKNHPALFGWDISNEDGENLPNGAGNPLWPQQSSLTLTQLRQARTTIKAADPNHPILVRMHYWDPSQNPFGQGNWFADDIADIVMLNLYSNYAADRQNADIPNVIAQDGQRHVQDVRAVDPNAQIWFALAAFEEDIPGNGYFLRPTAARLHTDISGSLNIPEVSGIGFYQWGPEPFISPLWYLPRDGADLWQEIRSSISANTPRETPSISLTKLAQPLTARIGDTITYTITYNNTSLFEARNVLITDTLAAGIEYITGTASASAVYDAATRKMTWTFQSVPAGASGTVEFKARIGS